jgi:hypothetical protein
MDDPRSPAPDEREDPASAIAGAEEAEAAHAAAPLSRITARSEAARDAAEVLTALAHTIRSFILYDAANERIRGFLHDVRGKFERFLAAHGEMALEVRPWEIALGDEVVYADPDRERSLAFRLYRDGVRRLVLREGLEWEELVQLIGILSVRYKGIRTQEDDVVTLLWRAGFAHVEITATEGVVASQDDAGAPPVGAGSAGPRTPAQAAIFDAPYAFDYPWPNFTRRAAVEFRQVPPSLLARIAEEDGEETLARECVLLAREVLEALSHPEDPLAVEDVVPVLREASAFLATEGDAAALLALARTVAESAPAAGEARERLLAGWIDPEIVRRLVEKRVRDGEDAPPELVELLALTPGDHFGMLVELFAASPPHEAPRAVLQLLESQARGHAASLLERMATLEGGAAVELLGIIARGDPSAAAEAATAALARPEEEVQEAALDALDSAAYGAKVGRALVGALASPFAGVRLRAVEALARRRERRAFAPLLERVRHGESPPAEARVIGAALARLDPEQARPLFREWVRPAGLLGRLAPGQAPLRWAALGGLALLPGEESESLLERLAEHGAGELKAEAEAALRALRRPPGGAGA